MPSFTRARYLGGHPQLGRRVENTYLWVDDSGIYLGMVGRKCPVTWEDIAAVDVSDGRASKAPNAILAGVRGTVDRTTITVTTRAGQQAYQIDRVDAARVRAVLAPYLAKYRIGAAAPGVSMVEQLEKLADLHRSGALSDAEFAEAKSRLLS